ncbi:hypothetical protein HYPSUDRAFT_51277 [Hypholoma sublateritium FD-334 SS-4]|uniref:Methyltransferase domain-containing protein n=1 Tax=Hypholoma sublateritium (strain FD-334 SS-4) TaxID=945553 RepID=A0A0D2PJ60_HYPSF|nr:hypothetical protein HYPSUDRAFT_51277 [Hypholoma sublateritium FD-334 SS-4]
MAARLAASQLQPEERDYFPDSPTPVQRRFPSPQPRVQSHYRPFSTLFAEAPYTDAQPPKPTRLKRSSSVGAMQALSNMGIALAGSKDKFKTTKEAASSPRFPSARMPASLRFKTRRSPLLDDDAPSTSSGTTRPSPAAAHMKKKRSMVSLFTTSSDAPTVGSGNGEPNTGLRRSPLVANHVSPPPLPTPDNGNKTSPANKAVPSASDPDIPGIFLPKHIWSKRHNMTLHPYHEHVPYMQAYDPILLDNDYHTDLLLRHLSDGRPAFHDFGKRPPATVLDLGCGQGHWVLHAANLWRQSQITGLDIVDITLPAFETTENAWFKQGNFLDKKLPFPSKSFEFVRMANLALCIPKDLWTQLLDEIRRVLTPGGRVEIIDDQIHFPYAKLPTPEPIGKGGSASSLDLDEDELDEDEREGLDGETLQGHESAETDSTLVSDNSRPPSFDGKASQLTESPTVRPLDAQGRLADLAPRAVHQKHKYVVPSGRRYASQARLLALQRQAHASRDLEKVFRLMLRRQYGISYRPADRIVKYLQNIFGKDSAGKKFSFHIKLAPVDSPIGEPDDAVLSPQLLKKQWMGGDREKGRKRRDDKEPRTSGDGDHLGRSSSELSLVIPAQVSALPASMNAKAASRLGLILPSTPTGPPAGKGPQRAGLKPELSATVHDRRVPRRLSLLSIPPSGPPFSTSPGTTPPILTPKAAERLGIAYGPNDGSAIAPAQVERPPKVPRRRARTTQAPGLLVWPATYIALPPAELEMHACKNIHMLLGCRAALAEFVALHRDKDGAREVPAGEFDDIVWDYECFRRARLNWPADIPDPYEDDPATPATPHSAFDVVPVKHSRSAGSPPAAAPAAAAVGASDSFNGQYHRDDLTHVRTIRVFHAIKSDPGSLLGMFRSKSADAS